MRYTSITLAECERPISQLTFLQSEALISLVPAIESVVWWPARAILGDLTALFAILAGSAALLASAIVVFSARFGDHAIAAAGIADAGVRQRRWLPSFRTASQKRVLRQKEWTLLRRDVISLIRR